MRYFFAIVVGSMMLGCTERNNQHVELRSGEAAEASRLIKSLGGACTTRFDVASFCGRLHTASANVTSKLERAELADQYCRALLDLDLLGSADNQDPLEVRGRCTVAKDFLAYSSETLSELGLSRFEILEFAAEMCAHLREESKRVEKAVAKRVGQKLKSPRDGWCVPWSKCPKMVDDVRRQWIWQYIDMPKCQFESIFKNVPPAEKERLLDKIEAEIGRKPNLF